MADPEPADHVTIVAETYGRAANTVSSLKSEDSTEQLICKSPPKKAPKVKKEKSLRSKSVEPSVTSDAVRARRLVVALGLAQLVLGALLAGGGALAVLKGAALARVGAGLWAGCVAVVAGVVGLLAGISDCYGVEGKKGSGLLTGFLALSLLALACGNSAAVLAATGLHRDAARPTPQPETFEEEMEAWTPVLTNIVVLIVAGVQCLVCVVAVYHLSRRLCSCFQPQPQFDHNQFDATSGKPPATYLVHVDEGKKGAGAERGRGHELARELEGRLRAPGEGKQGEGKQKKEEASYGSASSRSRLVSSWLGGQRGGAGAGGGGGRVRKARGAPVVLLPALPPPHMRMPHPQHHPASTKRLFFALYFPAVHTGVCRRVSVQVVLHEHYIYYL
ncbi:hypothetical protein JYU34_013172 [Plutella xylostella]|uniref:Transmembrane protein 176B n=1 Tax=Plutella xylostella TaxID=51655 RepID=A0ABQ7QDK8_PLUXY|nr:hypothetical protein JYU34_013172 [Plutella xylostella]